MLPMSEYDTVVWTEEMSAAFFSVEQLISDGDVDKAMVSFITKYRDLCDQAEKSGKPVVWTPSLGWQRNSRFHVLADAVRKGRISVEQAIESHPEMKHEFMKIKQPHFFSCFSK
jgi:hypothetical protein